jgi:hypothetical protein
MSASSSSDREIGGVEDVLGVDAQGELRGDGQYGRKGEYRRRRGPEQQAQGEGGYERAQRVEPLAEYRALAQPLGGERAGDDQGDVGWRLVEAERADAVNQQQSKREDLPDSRVRERDPLHCATRRQAMRRSAGESGATLVAAC